MTPSRPEGAQGKAREVVLRVGGDEHATPYMWESAIATALEEYAREQVEKVFHETGPPTISEQWLRDAHSRGVDVVEAVTEYANVRAQLQTLRGERDAHEKCIEEIQADSLKVAERENELHAEKDAQIAGLTQEKAALEARPVRVFNDNRDDLCAYILELEARERALVGASQQVIDAMVVHDDGSPTGFVLRAPLVVLRNALTALAPRRG